MGRPYNATQPTMHLSITMHSSIAHKLILTYRTSINNPPILSKLETAIQQQPTSYFWLNIILRTCRKCLTSALMVSLIVRKGIKHSKKSPSAFGRYHYNHEYIYTLQKRGRILCMPMWWIFVFREFIYANQESHRKNNFIIFYFLGYLLGGIHN